MRRERAVGGLGVITVVDWLLPRRVAWVTRSTRKRTTTVISGHDQRGVGHAQHA